MDSTVPETDEDTPLVRKFNTWFAIIQIIYIPGIIIGNTLLMLAILLFKRAHQLIDYMMLSLTVADLSVGVFTCPLYTAFYLQPDTLLQNRTACLIRHGSLIMSYGAPFVNFLVIVVDRYFIIVHHTADFNRKRPRNIIVMISLAWVYIIVISALPLMFWNTFGENDKCIISQVIPFEYTAFASISSAFASLLVSMVLYIRIAIYIRQYHIGIHDSNDQDGRAGRSMTLDKEIYYTKFIVGIHFLFVLFWLPYFIITILKDLKVLPQETAQILKNGALVLAFSNPMFNPIVYMTTRQKVRYAIILLLTTPVWQWSDFQHFRLGELPRKSSFRRSTISANY